jgi:hypothetical protein
MSTTVSILRVVKAPGPGSAPGSGTTTDARRRWSAVVAAESGSLPGDPGLVLRWWGRIGENRLDARWFLRAAPRARAAVVRVAAPWGRLADAGLARGAAHNAAMAVADGAVARLDEARTLHDLRHLRPTPDAGPQTGARSQPGGAAP